MNQCIMNTLNKEVQDNILTDRIKYMLSGHPSGLVLFELSIQKAINNMRETAEHFKDNMSSLDTYMTTANAKIE